MWSSMKSLLPSTLQLSFKSINYYKIKLRYWLAFNICKMPFYAVARGRERGIYLSWPECKEQIDGIKYAVYKKFDTEKEAEKFIKDNKGGNRMAPEVIPPYANVPDPIAPVSTEELFISIESRITKMECLLLPLIDEMKKARMELNTLRTATFTSITNASLKRQFSTVSTNSDDQGTSSTSKHRKISESSAFDDIDLTDLVNIPESEYSFNTDKDGFVQVYTDGACGSNGQQNAKAGLGVYFGEEHPLNTSQPVSRRATNNCGEIQAATCAINLARKAGITKLCINTDSQFLINAMTKWIGGWKKHGWKLSGGGSVKNKEDFIELDATAKFITVKWNYVKAHHGILGNERADALAKEGAAQYKTRRQW